ncbi:methyl-accepting chemotaxis protein [Rhizobium sp. FY34]|uniref:methyl-accepting chemotaxis protein n=1 Tax=Rhizobium sp. FY34 TaxID=2562309 RepID=UPI0010BFC0E9|nr:methyl-accepting chemotaxis protein [Rhizobium sp. FY34]
MLKMIKSLPLTAKLATLIVGINLLGMAGLAAYTWRSESASMLSMAKVNWSKDTTQFATLAAGGIKWGKADAVAETYSLYRDDAALNLVQFSAYNAELKLIDSWNRSGLDGLPSTETLAKDVATRPEKLMVDENALGAGFISLVSPLPLDKNGKVGGYVVTTWTAESILADARRKALIALGLQACAIVAAIIAFIFSMRRLVGQPLNVLSHRITALQGGDLATPVIYQQNGDEIGFLARALEGFRNDAIATLEQRRLAEQQQVTINNERARNAELTEASAATQRRVMNKVGHALEMLAKGQLNAKLDDLGTDFEKLRLDFNVMVDSIADAINEIKTASIAVETGAGQLADQAEQLARRTEQQAAALEETAAALDEVTTTVRNSSRSAEQTGSMVSEAKTEAHLSAQVVRNAIGAMDRIQHSSSQIGQIISVIDEIAFQTNLLALNAGVEAARAGEAGKGFAVVAQEVRELAQRSANAAKEIKHLIGVSNTEVSGGVALVNQTGDALLKIEDHISRINEGIVGIVESYRQQSSGLQEINSAINSMDQTTQQNAAMVEETSAACHDLLSQSRVMQGAADRFRLERVHSASGPARRVA